MELSMLEGSGLTVIPIRKLHLRINYSINRSTAFARDRVQIFSLQGNGISTSLVVLG